MTNAFDTFANPSAASQGSLIPSLPGTSPNSIFDIGNAVSNANNVLGITTQNPPADTYLILQKEAALKFLGKPHDSKSSQLATLLKPWFDMTLVHNFDKNDFFPKPMVDIVLMRIEKRSNPLISADYKQLFEDFIVYTYNQFQPNVIDGL